jgi:hypothetical protein
MPQQQPLLNRTQMISLKPIQAENRQGEALYRVRIVDTAPTRIFMLMKDIGPELARPNVLLVGVISKIFTAS